MRATVVTSKVFNTLVCCLLVSLILHLLKSLISDDISKCVSTQAKAEYPLRFRPKKSTQHGIPFNIDPAILRNLKISFSNYTILNKETARHFVFVMGASDNHFNESLDCIGSVQQHFPEKKLIYYDIGLTDRQARKISRMCNVEYRKFDFDKFPGHLRFLATCAWKPILIMLALQEFGGVFYLDASERMRHNQLDEAFDTAIMSGGFVAFGSTSNRAYQAVAQERYNYLPADRKGLRKLSMFAASIVLFYKTKEMYEKIVYWWVMCSLEQYCGAPHLDRFNCDCKGFSMEDFCKCDRFDQATLNVLVHDYYDYDNGGQPFQYKIPKHSGSINLFIKKNQLLYKIKYC